MKNNKSRIFQYDFIRAFAIITVVASHVLTNFENTHAEFKIKEYLNTIIRFSVPIFLFLSGVLFRTTADFEYLKKKFLRVLIPYSIVSIPALAFLVWKNNWNFSNLPEIILSYIFGYGFGYYFVFLILFMYILGYLVVKGKLIEKINLILFTSFALQFVWLAFDEFIYAKFGFRDIIIHQFNLNDLVFYLNPLTWSFFFILGFWYQKKENKDFIAKQKAYITTILILVFALYNLRIFFKFGDYTPYGSIIWSVFSTAIILFLTNMNVEKWKSSKAINYLSINSFGIFLIHYFFIYFLVEIEKSTGINFPYVATLIFFPAIILASIAVISAVKKIGGKKSMWIIGS